MSGSAALGWSELLWNQALIEKVGEQTLMLDTVFPPPRTQPRSLADVARSLGKDAKERIAQRSSRCAARGPIPDAAQCPRTRERAPRPAARAALETRVRSRGRAAAAAGTH